MKKGKKPVKKKILYRVIDKESKKTWLPRKQKKLKKKITTTKRVPLKDVTKKFKIIKLPPSPGIPVKGLIGRKSADEILLRAVKDFVRTKDVSIYDNTKKALKLMNKSKELHSEIDRLEHEGEGLYKKSGPYETKAGEDREAARQLLILSRDHIKAKEKELEYVDAEVTKNIVFLNSMKEKFKEKLPPTTQKAGSFVTLDSLAKKLETDIKAGDKEGAIKRIIKIDKIIERWRHGNP